MSERNLILDGGHSEVDCGEGRGTERKWEREVGVGGREGGWKGGRERERERLRDYQDVNFVHTYMKYVDIHGYNSTWLTQ